LREGGGKKLTDRWVLCVKGELEKKLVRSKWVYESQVVVGMKIESSNVDKRSPY
jgi:hypothetical protein